MSGSAQRRLEVLDRVVVILLALAVLAERAAGATGPVRCVVLWVLRQADTVAKDFVAGSSCNGRRRPPFVTLRDGDDPAEALNLAASFRMLAFTLETMATQLRRLAFLHGGRPPGPTNARPPHDMRSVLDAAIARAGRPDTS